MPSDDPRSWPLEIAPNGDRHLTLPSGIVKVYSEARLAEMCIELMLQAQTEPDKVDDRWYETLRYLAGEEEWAHAITMVAALT